MKEYIVKRYASYNDADWENVPIAEISHYGWIDGYNVGAYAQVIIIDDIGFVARLSSDEKNPLALKHEFFDDVCCDSCLEFFASFDNTCVDYLNVEMNSIGTSNVSLGPDRYERVKLTDIIEKPFPVRSVVREDGWSATAFITFDNLERIYGIKKDVFAHGYSFKGNFYKCGDETEIPHYAMWNPVETEEPDYHRPEYFGTLIIE